MLRKETIGKIANSLRKALDDDKISTEDDIIAIIELATMSEKKKKALGEEIKARRKELEKMEAMSIAINE